MLVTIDSLRSRNVNARQAHKLPLQQKRLTSVSLTLLQGRGPTPKDGFCRAVCAGKGVLTSADDKWIHLSYLDSDVVVSWHSDGVNELVMLRDGRLLITPYGENKVCFPLQG